MNLKLKSDKRSWYNEFDILVTGRIKPSYNDFKQYKADVEF